MKETIIAIAITYGVIGASIGSLFASMDTVEAKWKGKSIKFPRTAMFVAALVGWPYALWQITQWRPK